MSIQRKFYAFLALIICTTIITNSIGQIPITNQEESTITTSVMRTGSPIKTNLIVQDGVLNTGEYDYNDNIRYGRYYFSYSIIGDTIHIAMKFKGLGWISMGFGYLGYPAMSASDVATGYVDENGKVYLDDYWSTGDPGPAGIAVPDYDAQQDIISYNGTQGTYYTTIEFSKKLNTFDTAQDSEIIPGAQGTLMVAFHSTIDSPGWIHDDKYDLIYIFYGNPSAPKNLVATYAESKVDLSWNAPSGNGGFALTDYKIYRSLNGGTYQLLTTITDTSTTLYTDLSVINGENYTYAVTASNGNTVGEQESGYSNKVSVIPMGPLLNPANLIANTSSENVTLTWDYPLSDGGIPVDSFKIYKSQNITGSYNQVGISSSPLKYSDYDVINGFTYYYYVLAEHEFLTSNASNTITANPIGPPTAPLDLITEYTDNLAALMWTVPLSDGGFSITSYSVYRSDTLSGVYSYINSTTTTTYNDSNVINGETYYYRVTANNSAGESDFSNIQRITLAFVPTTPSNVQSISSDGNITISWDASDPKGYTILFYTVYRSDGYYNPFVFLENVTDLLYTDINVINSKTYYYKITANNTIGESSYSIIISGTPASPPSEPINLSVLNKNGGVKLNWKEPLNSGGYFISYYSIERKVDAGEFISYAESQSKELLDKSIEYGLNYTYRIRAHNIIGASNYSDLISIVPGTTPSIPISLEASIYQGNVALIWSEANDGGAQITSYNVYRSVGSNTSLSIIGTSRTLFYTDNTNSTSIYYYAVTAVNSLGESDLSNEVSIIPASVSSEPLDIVGIAGNKEVTLLWSPPLNDGGLVILKYNLYISDNNETGFELVDYSTSLLYTVSNLNNNQTYFFYVTSVNEVGESNASNIVSVVPREGYVNPDQIANNSISNSSNLNSTSDLDFEQIRQTILIMLGLGATAMTIFVIRIFVQNKFKKN